MDNTNVNDDNLINDTSLTQKTDDATNNSNSSVDSNTQQYKKYKMTIDQDVCIRCGSCHIMYPEVFEGRADGTSYPIDGVTVDKDKAEDMKLICPVEAIDLIEVA